MPYSRFLLFILILGSVWQSGSGQNLPGVITAPPRLTAAPTPKPGRPARPQIENEPAHVTSLALEKYIVYSSCTAAPDAECPGEAKAMVRVTTAAEDKENDILTYQYTVSAGRITGQGTSVVWDLSGTPPGTYSMIAGTDDGYGVRGRTMTTYVEVRPTPVLEKVSLDHDRVYSLCPRSRSESPRCSKEQMIVDLTVTAKNVTDDLEYFYIATGGEVTGSGAHVKWDFREALPGTYDLTVGIGRDHVILSKTIVRSVKKEECPCDPGCWCPASFTITGPTDPVAPGDTIVVTSNIKSNDKDIRYRWSVTAGSILGDPAGPSIMVKVPADAKEYILVTFELLQDTNPACYCQKSETLTVYINKKPAKPSVPELK